MVLKSVKIKTIYIILNLKEEEEAILKYNWIIFKSYYNNVNYSDLIILNY